MKKNKGFTLIELLAVIVILGIMLTISVVAVNKIRRNQEKENIKNVVSSILTGAKRYVSEKRVDLSTTDTIKVLDIKSNDFVDFDETNKRIKDLKLTEKDVHIKVCPENNLKLFYYIEDVEGTTYNDCGCKEQVIGTADKICEN